jgi:hypothetical protein
VGFFTPPGLANSDVKPARKTATDLSEKPDTLLEPLRIAFAGNWQLVLGIALIPGDQPRSKIKRKTQCPRADLLADPCRSLPQRAAAMVGHLAVLPAGTGDTERHPIARGSEGPITVGYASALSAKLP